MRRFTDKVVAITGGGSGMGKTTCEMFANEGGIIAVIDVNEQGALETVKSIEEKGGKAKAYKADITDEKRMAEVFEDIYRAFGHIDILYNNAGISPTGTAVTTSIEDFRKVLRIDMEAVFIACHIVIPYMEKQGGGVILNTVGTYGLRPTPNKIGYSAAKAAALSLTRSIAVDFARSNIRCNAICPGFVDTPLNKGFEGEARERFLDKYQPSLYKIQPEDIALTAMWLASDEAKAITGQPIVVDGGTEACLYFNYKKPSELAK